MKKSTTIRWALLIALLLVTWGLRLGWLDEVPPGWRDDELINIHALSNQLLDGRFPLYYPGASGHEPLYHHLHAGVHAVLGFNVLSGHILSVAFGTLSVALTHSLVRRLFPGERLTAFIASLTLSVSFWSLMYSRTAIRHISLPPFALATLYVFCRLMDAERPGLWGWGLAASLLSASIYTYTASRLLPVLLLVVVAYLALFHRDQVIKHWRGIVLCFALTALLVAPLGVAISRNRSKNAIEGIGADARVTELARPLRALQDGDPVPMIASTVKTLGMFHASGDPEWLYNIPGRPVFNLLGGTLLWMGVALCLYRWRDPRYFLFLPWLALGLSPAFISTPPASLGHTILAQPAVYVLPSLALTEITRWFRSRQSLRPEGAARTTWFSNAVVALIVAAFVVSNAFRDVRDYFVVWPERGMVRLLYRADQREAAQYLDAHPEITDAAVGSGLMGPWDRIALEVDIRREELNVRLFNPERALVWPAGDDPPPVFLPSWPKPTRPIQTLLASGGEDVLSSLTLHTPPSLTGSGSMTGETIFANGLTLTQVRWLEGQDPSPEEKQILLTVWKVSEPIELPPIPVVAQPPPPRTYTGPRLAVFAHLVDGDGGAVEVDDGLWVDPLTLQPGDRFAQIHRFSVPDGLSTGSYTLELGLYDPKTSDRWLTLDASGEPDADRVRIPLGGQR